MHLQTNVDILKLYLLNSMKIFQIKHFPEQTFYKNVENTECEVQFIGKDVQSDVMSVWNIKPVRNWFIWGHHFV